jgi:phosphonate transport system ATP-binding protein
MQLALRAVSAAHPAARDKTAHALKAVSVSIASGEQLAVIGPSGAGKTTLLHVLACALRPAQGQLTLGEAQPWELSTQKLQALRGALFLCPQMPPLPPRQRVVTAVLAGALPHQSLWKSLQTLFYPTDLAAAREALASFDLADKLFERVDKLSGGERQRVGLARAALSRATLLLVDEPLSSLDPTRASAAIGSLKALATSRGATLVCTLHQVDMALAQFPRIVGMREGQVAFDLPAAQVSRELLAELYRQHEDELTGPAPAVSEPVAVAMPAVMTCR